MAKVTKKAVDKSKSVPVKNISDSEERQKALANAMKHIEMKCGTGSVMKLGDHADTKVSSIPTGILSLDLALGVGGLPRGRIVEIYGQESSGKTTIALHALAEAQRRGGYVAFIDAEHALDPTYAAKLGVNTDELIVSQPDNGEQALEITEALVRSGAVDMIIVDSVAALVPKAEIDGDMGATQVGGHARLMSQALRKLAGIVQKSQTVLVFINQTRQKIGAPTYGYAVPETTTGGVALKFYASVRVEVKGSTRIEDGSTRIGNKVHLKIVKNKLAPPFRNVEVDMLYGEGVSKLGCLIDLALEHEILNRSGAWISYNGQNIGQGKEKARTYLKEKPEVAEEIDLKLREMILNREADFSAPKFTGPIEEDAGEIVSDADLGDALDDLLDLDDNL